MTNSAAIAELLQVFPGVQPQQIVPLGNAGGFSGARLWRITTAEQVLCLRQWPAQHPDAAFLAWIHGLLQHASDQGLTQLPVPLPHRGNDTVINRYRRLYELTPWMPGQADYHAHPNTGRLTAAMTFLARFHLAAGSYARQESPVQQSSPGLAERSEKLAGLLNGGAKRLAIAVAGHADAEIRWRGERLLALFQIAADGVGRRLRHAASLQVELQPCIRDIWHDHLLFSGDMLTGVVDFGAVRRESVAGDLARLLGSLVGDDRDAWSNGLAAYQEHRQLTEAELLLIQAFDQSGVLMSGLTWLQWICVEGRSFDDRPRILDRMDENLRRLEQVCQ